MGRVRTVRLFGADTGYWMVPLHLGLGNFRCLARFELQYLHTFGMSGKGMR